MWSGTRHHWWHIIICCQTTCMMITHYYLSIHHNSLDNCCISLMTDMYTFIKHLDQKIMPLCICHILRLMNKTPPKSVMLKCGLNAEWWLCILVRYPLGSIKDKYSPLQKYDLKKLICQKDQLYIKITLTW